MKHSTNKNWYVHNQAEKQKKDIKNNQMNKCVTLLL